MRNRAYSNFYFGWETWRPVRLPLNMSTKTDDLQVPSVSRLDYLQTRCLSFAYDVSRQILKLRRWARRTFLADKPSVDMVIFIAFILGIYGGVYIALELIIRCK